MNIMVGKNINYWKHHLRASQGLGGSAKKVMVSRDECEIFASEHHMMRAGSLYLGVT